MKKILLLTIIFTSVLNLTFAFDWPQNQTASDSFYSYFGQLRGGTISSSLIFQDNSEIKAADAGEIIGIIKEHNDTMGWFESTLGNTVLLNHSDSLVTIYANLDREKLCEEVKQPELGTGTKLGISGNSGWQDGQSCLEFKVLDTKKKTVVNPRILMPRIGKELPLNIGTVILVDKNGAKHNLAWERWLPSGVYYVYKERQEVALPYKTIVAVNGATMESIDYDKLSENEGKLCVGGTSMYSVDELYPDLKRHLVAKIQLTHGKNALSVTAVNILGSAVTQTFNLEIN